MTGNKQAISSLCLEIQFSRSKIRHVAHCTCVVLLWNWHHRREGNLNQTLRGRYYGENIPIGSHWAESPPIASVTESTCKPTSFCAFPLVSGSAGSFQGTVRKRCERRAEFSWISLKRQQVWWSADMNGNKRA